MDTGKTDEQARFASVLDGIRSKILLMVVDAGILDLVPVNRELNGNTDE